MPDKAAPAFKRPIVAPRPAPLRARVLDGGRRNITPDSLDFRKAMRSLSSLRERAGRGWDFAKSYGIGFQREIYFGIDVGGADRDMAEPGADGIDVHAGENQVASRRVPDHMRGYRSFGQFRHPGRATLDKAIDSEAGKWRSEPADKCGVIARVTVDPFGDDVFDQEAPEPWAKGYEFRHPDLPPHSEQSEEMQKLRRHRHIDLRAFQVGMAEVGGEYG
jgi:hypothetical protein